MKDYQLVSMCHSLKVLFPIISESLRFYNILNILPNESRIFSTKQRAPFYICLEVYCPA